MNIKQQYCIVTQEEANEARELLVRAGESIAEAEAMFEVDESNFILQYETTLGWMVISDEPEDYFSTQLTYPQFKEMLNEKIKEDGK